MSRILDFYYLKTCYLLIERLCGFIPDRTFLKLKYLWRFHRFPDLESPETFSEKLQWLKLNYRPELYKTLADKYEVRNYVAERIGSEHLIPLIGWWEKAEDIPFEDLPNQFVLKCNHDSGSIIICKDKSKLDYQKTKRYLNRAIKRDYYLNNREWPYKDIKRKIIAEEVLCFPDGTAPEEYKFFCFNGKVEFFKKSQGRAHSSEYTDDFYDKDYNHINLKLRNAVSEEHHLVRTDTLDTMKKLAEDLSEGMPHVRVDFYDTGEQIYFGEMTFFTWGGFSRFDPPEWDGIFGKLIILPTPKKKLLFMISSLAGGGAERVTVNLSNALCDDYDVCLVTLFSNPDDYALDEKIHCLRFSEYAAGLPKLKRKITGYCSYLVKLLWVRKIKKSWKPDATISMLTVQNLFNALIKSGDFRIVSERADPSVIGGSYYRYAKISSLLADHTVFQSRRVQRMFSEIVQKKSSIILNPVTVSCSADENKEKRIVTAGRLSEQKNHLMLIRAFGRFSVEHPDYTLEIYGKGPLKESLEDEIKTIGLENRALIKDFSYDLHDSIKSAEMFVLSSDFEGLSNALLEAMMMGIPCISTDCAGSDEIIEDGRNGLLVPVGDENALCEAMKTLADDSELREAIAAESRRRSERFSRETVINQWKDLIEKGLEARR